MLSICILETDHLRPELVGRYQSYGHLFQQLFARQPVPASFAVFNVVDGEYPSEGQTFDAYLVTGSKADAFGQQGWINVLRTFLLERYQRGDTLLGICFGHQLLALLLGGECGRAAQGWGLGVHRYQCLEPQPWMTPPRADFALLVSHQDQVSALPDGAQLLASSLFCPVAAFSIGEQVLCFQGHPEFVEGYAQDLLDLRREGYGEDLYSAATATVQQGHDGALIAQWMLQFVMQRRS
ncbi:amidotransferase [Pseudomonas sp. R5(2019)]|uniref:amidotransferase n=1 Tax=Pseudomonas sp. R5(2019) TaxID=2697566 RepID=UPI001411D889|nr:amidotransferase [Pseudomonas sp. R5(2019)]NBA98381.1 amidotransferase [Pseudomonas sp. R5(2019)]